MITEYLPYVIFFQDVGEYQFATAVAGGNLLALNPRDAATMFGIPFPYPSGDMDLIPRGIYFLSESTPGQQISFPNPSGVIIDDTVDSMFVPGQAGNPPSVWPANQDGLFVWSGAIVHSRGAGASTNPPANGIAQRRFAIGFEWSLQHEGSGTIELSNTSKDASRTIDGKGFAIRGSNWGIINVSVAVLRAVTPSTSWERFYLRVRRLPAATSIIFWRCHGSPNNLAGAALRINAAGQIRLINISAGGIENDKGVVFTPVINEWNRLDIHLKYATGASTSGIVNVWLNGVFAFGFTDTAFEGMNQNSTHTTTDLGRQIGIDEEVELDIDDWISSELPTNMNAVALTFNDVNFPMDWLLGSHVRAHFAVSATLTGWAPNAYGNLNQGQNALNNLTSAETSSTSGATMQGLTDALLQSIPDSIANVLGVASATIGVYNRNAGGTDGQLGYRKAGAAATLVTINQQSSDAIQVAGYTPAGMIIPDEVSPWSVVHTKSADANLDTTTDLVSILEYLGVWGPEDDPLFDFPVSRLTFIHNGNYANTAWGYVGPATEMPVFAHGATYAGNSLTQRIPLPGPCHFIWQREISGAVSGGFRWFGTSIGATQGAQRIIIPNIRVFSDINGDFWLEVTGSHAAINQTGRTYQIIAFCDPGMRFNLTGVFNHAAASISPKVNPLIESGFLAQSGFIQSNLIAGASPADGLFFKGPGIINSDAVTFSASAIKNNFINFASGILNSLTGAHNDSANTVYSLWKSSDGGGCAGTVVQILTYTGNGVHPRVIPLTPATGLFPLFVLVMPYAAANGYYRDPSHTGTNSSFASNDGLITTAIIATGIDSITVQSSLNANGVVYSVLCICGSNIGQLNGTFSKQMCDTPPGGPWVDPLPPQGDINVMGEGGLVFDGDPATLIIKDASGIYTLVEGKLNDTLIDRQTGQTSVDVPILPIAKTGYIGG